MPSVARAAGHGRWPPRDTADLHLDGRESPPPARSARPGDFRVGKDHRRNRPRIKHRRLAMDRLNGHLALVAGPMGEHRLSTDIADRIDAGSLVRCYRRRPQTPCHQRSRRCFPAQAVRVGTSPDRHQHPGEGLSRRPLRAFEVTSIPVPTIFQPDHLRAEHDALRKAPPAACANGLTRSRSAPGRSPSVSSTTETRAQFGIHRPHLQSRCSRHRSPAVIPGRQPSSSAAVESITRGLPISKCRNPGRPGPTGQNTVIERECLTASISQ
jgi:hypothetical protein